MTTKRIFPWVLAVSKRLLRQMSTTTTSRFLSEYDRATLRSTLASGAQRPRYSRPRIFVGCSVPTKPA